MNKNHCSFRPHTPPEWDFIDSYFHNHNYNHSHKVPGVPHRKILPKPSVSKCTNSFNMDKREGKLRILKPHLMEDPYFSDLACNSDSTSTSSAENSDYESHVPKPAAYVSSYMNMKPSTADIDLFQPIIKDDVHPLIPGNHF